MFKNVCSENFDECKTKQEVIEKYRQNVELLQQIAQQQLSIEVNAFHNYLLRNFFYKLRQRRQLCKHDLPVNIRKNYQIFSVNSLKEFGSFSLNRFQLKLRQYYLIIVIICSIIFLVRFKLEASNVFMRNIQPLIYPGMRTWRKFTIPIIENFPQLTRLYDESCLVENPFFQVAGLDCTPCASVINVLDISSNKYPGYLDYRVPYVVQVVYFWKSCL